MAAEGERAPPGRRVRASSACGTHGVRAESDPRWNAPTPRHEHGHVGGDALPPTRPCRRPAAARRHPAGRKPELPGHGATDRPRSDGTLAAVINLGGFLGFGSRPVSVPVDALVLLGQVLEVDAFTPAQLRQLPTYSPRSAAPLSPDAIIKVGLAKPSH